MHHSGMNLKRKWLINPVIVILLAVALEATFACKKASSISKESIGDYDTCFRNTIIIDNGGRTNSWRKPGYKLF